MSELISKETLICEIVNTPTNSDCYNSAYQTYTTAYHSGSATRQFEILDIIKKMPTVSEQEIRDEAIDTFMIAIETHMKVVGNTYLEDVREIAKRLKESKQMNNRTKFDEPTSKWFEEHTDVQTTVCKCDSCGLFYKPSLGHKCKKGVAEQ